MTKTLTLLALGVGTKEAAFLTPAEQERLAEATRCVLRGDKPIEVLIDEPEAWDVAAFGRMFASDPAHSIEAAIQVAHAVTVKPAAPQADFFSTVEELAAPGETGAAHTGERELSAGTFYGYICIDGGALGRALGETGARKVVRRLVEAICKRASDTPRRAPE